MSLPTVHKKKCTSQKDAYCKGSKPLPNYFNGVPLIMRLPSLARRPASLTPMNQSSQTVVGRSVHPPCRTRFGSLCRHVIVVASVRITRVLGLHFAVLELGRLRQQVEVDLLFLVGFCATAARPEATAHPHHGVTLVESFGCSLSSTRVCRTTERARLLTLGPSQGVSPATATTSFWAWISFSESFDHRSVASPDMSSRRTVACTRILSFCASVGPLKVTFTSCDSPPC